MVFGSLPKEIDRIKEILKQIESESMALADRIKLDGQQRWGLEDKFKKIYSIIEEFIKPEEPIFNKPEPRIQKVDASIPIKKKILR